MGFKTLLNHEYLPRRNETRFAVPLTLAQKALYLLNNNYSQEVHDANWTRSVYFSSQKMETPSGAVIRGRRYACKQLPETMELNLRDEWFLESKGATGQKERIKLPLENILIGLSYPEMYDTLAAPSITEPLKDFHQPMLPIAATESRRSHFIDGSARITVDEDIAYFGFKWGTLTGERMGNKKSLKIEIKKPNDEPDTAATTINDILAQLDATPIEDGEHEKDMRIFYGKYLEAHR